MLTMNIIPQFYNFIKSLNRSCRSKDFVFHTRQQTFFGSRAKNNSNIKIVLKTFQLNICIYEKNKFKLWVCYKVMNYKKWVF